MRLLRTSLTITALTGALALGLSSCSEPAEDPNAGIGAAGDDTVLTIYTSEPEEKVDEINAAFEKEHPDIQVEVYRAGTGDLKARIESERESGQVEADLMWAADAPTFEGLKSEDLLAELKDVDTSSVMEEAVDPEGYYVGTRIIPTVIAYNTDVIEESDAPESWVDLTDEKFRDKIVLPDPSVSGAAAFNATVWMNNEELGESWVEGLGQNSPMIAASNGPTSQEIAGGGHPVGIVVDYLVRDLAEQGSPIKEVYATEGSPYITEPIGVFANSEQQEAAEKYITFLLSEAGQKLAVEQNYLPVIDGIDTPGDAPGLDDIELMDTDLETLTGDRDRSVESFEKAMK